MTTTRTRGFSAATAAGLTAMALLSGTVMTPAAEAATGTWENCGKNICTTYYSKTDTKAFARYFDSGLGGLGSNSEKVFCSSIAGLVARLPGVVVGATCDFGDYGVSAWHKAANRAVRNGGCLQVERPANGIGLLKPGYTKHKKYCRG